MENTDDINWNKFVSHNRSVIRMWGFWVKITHNGKNETVFNRIKDTLEKVNFLFVLHFEEKILEDAKFCWRVSVDTKGVAACYYDFFDEERFLTLFKRKIMSLYGNH